MPSVLKQTLRVASGIVFALVETAPTCAATQGTAPTMADGSDLTGSSLTASDDIDPGVGGASGTYREEWTLGSAAATGTIDFIVVIARTHRAGSPPSGITASYRPSINGTSRGTEHAVTDLFDDAQQFTTDPADGLPWTNAKINAQRFGWYLTAGAAGPVSSLDASCACSVVDYRVELWGEDVSGASTVEIAGTVDVAGEGVLEGDVVAGVQLGETDEGVLSAPVVSGGALGFTDEGRIFKG